MFWSSLDLKQTITLPDQSTSNCRNGVVWIQIYLCQEMQLQHFHNFWSLLRGLCGKKFDRQQPFNTNQPKDKANTHRHIGWFSLCEPLENNGLSNFSLLILLSIHFVKSCWKRQESINFSRWRLIKTWNNCFYLYLQLSFVFAHNKNNVHTIGWLKKKAECAPETDEKIGVCF